MLALVAVPSEREGALPALEPRVLSLREMLEYFIAHRKDVIVRRTRHELEKARERAHILEGFRIALDHIDEIIAIIRKSDSTETARQRLIERFALSVIQANAILDMRLRALTALERQKIEDEYTELIKLIAELEDILASDRRVLAIVKSETLDLRKRFADPRRTEIVPFHDEFDIEDMIPDAPVAVTSTDGGYIKRVSIDTFRAQNRGGRGVIGIANLKREDVVRNLFMATTHQHVLFFTTKGRAYRLRAY
jgi:DNA gyrase subunit A